MGLREKDPKCRYQVHLPQASWHTAYDVCLQKNMTLVRLEALAEKNILAEVLEEVDNMMNNFSIKSNYSDVWIGGIMRTSNNESMYLDCKSFKLRHQIIMPKEKLKDKMACLYFNLTDKKLHVESCERNKTFVCKSRKQAPENCTMVTKTNRLRDDSVYALSMDHVH
ncbi:uncharacterized protein LOC134265736 [Saccostrea cucullata]|uniref:uncharacterized protein LOC134265736 n=1 Tax=Saccostrea cuccullata TaxID=36930 RepID=UPI002ECFC051